MGPFSSGVCPKRRPAPLSQSPFSTPGRDQAPGEPAWSILSRERTAKGCLGDPSLAALGSGLSPATQAGQEGWLSAGERSKTLHPREDQRGRGRGPQHALLRRYKATLGSQLVPGVQLSWLKCAEPGW